MITIQDIDHLAEKFYQHSSFNAEHFPNFDELQELFFGDGKLINNSTGQPIELTVQSFAQSIMKQIESGDLQFFAQQEISDITEVYGGIAQRISVFEYSLSQDPNIPWKRGVNYLQFIKVGEDWKITSAIWSNELEGEKIPEFYLIGLE